ncbi:MAG: 7-carboxy-7-deazaguanine synthase QueE, partial [Selenomonadaceae bacterium]|nr:7-carboxy-7-deazaguanine synthase QueE [Selenomonadaceae bacterium]
VVGRNLLPLHEKFLQVAHGKDLYVKIVVTGSTTRAEFLSAVETVAKVDEKILLILQPVTPVNSVSAASAEKILSFQADASKLLRDVRVIPQTHRFINLL